MITLADVAHHLGVDEADPAMPWLVDAVAATNEWVAGLPVLVDRPDPAAEWPADVRAGAIMLAAHIYQSRNAPSGRPTFDGGMAPAYADPEIARLLRLRRHTRPGVWA